MFVYACVCLELFEVSLLYLYLTEDEIKTLLRENEQLKSQVRK